MHANLIHQPSHKRLCLLRALALASLAIAGLALPFAILNTKAHTESRIDVVLELVAGVVSNVSDRSLRVF